MKIRETLYFLVSNLFDGANRLLSNFTLYRWVQEIIRTKLPYLLSLFGFWGIEKNIVDESIREWIKKIGFRIFLGTFVLLFVVNCVWSLIDSTLFPDGSLSTHNFLEDTPNLLNYTVICPMYVTMGICFLVFIKYLRCSLNKADIFKHQRLPQESPKPIAIAFWGIIAIAICMFTLSFYFSELNKYSFVFWFQTMTPGGEKILSAHGYYYLLNNVLLNALTISVGIAHIELFIVAFQIAKKIKAVEEELKNTPPGGPWLSENQIVKGFSPFTSLYVISKILVVIYLINLYTWKAQEPGFTGMLDFTIILLAVLGSAIVSYPRYHIQYRIYKLWHKHKVEAYPEVRRPLQIGMANLADFLILGGAMTNLIMYVLHKSNINLAIF